ncbi:MAG: hypothetical protein AAGE85_07495 [Pseudomonadota bacterium]
MPRLSPIAICLLGIALFSAGAGAQTLGDMRDLAPEERKAYWESLSEEERSAQREAWRLERDSMSTEERQALAEQKRAEARERWDTMTPEEQAAARENRKARTEQRREKQRERWAAMSPEEQEEARENRRVRVEERRARKEAQRTDGSD